MTMTEREQELAKAKYFLEMAIIILDEQKMAVAAAHLDGVIQMIEAESI